MMRASFGDFDEHLILIVKTLIPRHEIATVQVNPCARVILHTFVCKVIVFCVNFPLLNHH
jgi:hypothetical protein